MLAVAEVTHLSGAITAMMPILAGITNATDHQQALDLMEELIEQYDENLVVIEALSNVIARYEDDLVRLETFNKRQADIDPAVATLRVLMDQNGLKMDDFENEIGKKSMVSQVLAGKKNLTRDHIMKLAHRFDVSPAVFF